MSQKPILSLTLAAALSLGTLALIAAPAAAEGINYLVQVTQLKAQNANDEALQGSAADRTAAGQSNVQTTGERPVLSQRPVSNISKKYADTNNGIVQNLK